MVPPGRYALDVRVFELLTTAASVANGPLSKTTVNLAKVATTSPNESPAQRLICVYMHDIFDKEKVLEVITLLFVQRGFSIYQGYACSLARPWCQSKWCQVRSVYKNRRVYQNFVDISFWTYWILRPE